MAHHAGVMVAIQGMFTAHRCPHGSREAGAPSPPYAASVMCCARWPLREEGLFSLSSLDHAAPQWIWAKNGLGFFVDSLLKHRAGVADRAFLLPAGDTSAPAVELASATSGRIF